MFMPHLDFVGSGHFKYPENTANVSPFSKTSTGFASSCSTVSLTSIGAICSLDRESVATALKAIFCKFVSKTEASLTLLSFSCRLRVVAVENSADLTCGSATWSPTQTAHWPLRITRTKLIRMTRWQTMATIVVSSAGLLD